MYVKLLFFITMVLINAGLAQNAPPPCSAPEAGGGLIFGSESGT